MNILSLHITQGSAQFWIRKIRKKDVAGIFGYVCFMRIEMPVRERELKILDVNLSGKR